MKKKDNIQVYLENIFTKNKIEKVYEIFSTKFLSTATVEDIAIKGIQKKLANDIVNVFKVRHASGVKSNVKITQSLDAYNVVKDLGSLDHEQFDLILVDSSNTVIKRITHSKCGISSTIVDVRLICLDCIRYKASGLILSHNHPSGNINPSKADLAITEKIKKALLAMDISLLDHIIIANESTEKYLSMADEGLM